jgi:hypothetical protein
MIKETKKEKNISIVVYSLTSLLESKGYYISNNPYDVVRLHTAPSITTDIDLYYSMVKNNIVYVNCKQNNIFFGKIKYDLISGRFVDLGCVDRLLQKYTSHEPILSKMSAVWQSNHLKRIDTHILLENFHKYISNYGDFDIDYSLKMSAEGYTIHLNSLHKIILQDNRGNFDLCLDGVWYLNLGSAYAASVNDSLMKFMFDIFIPNEYIREQKLKQLV